eukprot:scaffold16082_cov110-Isochrysis_galbana.AAC.7
MHSSRSLPALTRCSRFCSTDSGGLSGPDRSAAGGFAGGSRQSRVSSLTSASMRHSSTCGQVGAQESCTRRGAAHRVGCVRTLTPSYRERLKMAAI